MAYAMPMVDARERTQSTTHAPRPSIRLPVRPVVRPSSRARCRSGGVRCATPAAAHGTPTTDRSDPSGVGFLEPPEAFFHQAAEKPSPLEEPPALKQIADGEPGCTANGVTEEGRCVQRFPAAEAPAGHDFRRADTGRDGKAGGQALSEADQVGHHPIRSIRSGEHELTAAPKACEYLVEDQKHVVPVAECSKRAEPA